MTSQNNPQPAFDHPQPQSNEPGLGQIYGDKPSNQELIRQVGELSQKVDFLIKNHIHDGANAVRINWNTDIIGVIETVSSAPTIVPKSPYDQVKIYSSGGTFRLYVYDTSGNAWHFVALT